MECLTGNYGLGTQDGRESSFEWEIVQYPDNCEESIYDEKLGDLVEGKTVTDSSCSLLSESDLAFNI